MLTVIHNDALTALRTLDAESVQCVVTSPPYWGLRDYGVEGQLGLEKTPEEYVAKLVEIFREVRRVLRKDGTLWLNLGDSYAGGGVAGSANAFKGKQGSNHGSLNMVGKAVIPSGLKPKDLVGIPWSVAFALRADGWYLRSDIIWSKPNPMPESVTDRPTKAHEYIFLLAKSDRYYFDQDAVRDRLVVAPEHAAQRQGKNPGNRLAGAAVHGVKELTGNMKPGMVMMPNPDGRNIRSVWTIATQPFSEAHFATFPPDLIKPCILAGAPVGGVVLDPFAGSGTTGKVAIELGRRAVLIEPKAEYIEMIERRCKTTIGLPLAI